MDRRERHVEEKRSVAAGFEPLRGLAGDEVGDVALFFDELTVAMPRAGKLAFFIAMVERAGAAGERAVAVVEAKFLRPFLGLGAEMPFAGDGSVVAGGL